jgi:hypothetical protein
MFIALTFKGSCMGLAWMDVVRELHEGGLCKRENPKYSSLLPTVGFLKYGGLNHLQVH